MLIEKIRVQNFKSIVDSGEVKIDEGLTLLIGKNDQGKTNLLKALESFNKNYQYQEADWCYYVSKSEPKNAEIVKIWFRINELDREKLEKFQGKLAGIKQVIISKYFDNHYEVATYPQIEVEEEKLKEIAQKVESQIEALTAKTEQHTIRLPQFASAKSQYEKVASDFLSIDLKIKDVNAINQDFANLYNSLRTLPNKDAQIDTDIEDAIKEFEKIKFDLISAIKLDVEQNILSMLPTCIYFSSIDILPDSINIEEYLNNKSKYKTFTNLFELAGLNVEELKAKDVFERRRATNNATATITGLINESWKQEKVNINIGYDTGLIFVYVEDEAGAHDPPSRRSDGFQWFLSFYINFMAGTKGEFKEAVLLLDNPGWVLHPSGQKDLLDTLEKISTNNQIILATHSPFLIDKNKLERLRITKKETQGVGTKVYEKFYDSIYDSLQVIRASIGADISDSLFGHKNNIVVEGYSDKVYLETMTNYLRKKKKEFINLSKVMINGAGGADKLPFLLGWYKAEKYTCLGIVDNDNEGRRIIQEIKGRDTEVNVEEDILKLDEIDEEFKRKDIEMENLFDESFFNRAVNKTYAEVLQRKLGKESIGLEELPERKLITKKYEKFFEDRNIGGFDKVKVAYQIQKMLEKGDMKESESGNTIENFEKLFKKIKEKFSMKKAEI